MYKTVGIWSRPADEVGFEDHYAHGHSELARAVPGLVAVTTMKADSGELGAPYRIAEMYFPSQSSFLAALDSPAWAAMVQDTAAVIERFGVTLTTADGWETSEELEGRPAAEPGAA